MATALDSVRRAEETEAFAKAELCEQTPRSAWWNYRVAVHAVSWLPTVCVLLALLAIAAVGHQYNWKIPKFGDLTHSNATATVPWCDSHGVTEAECIDCNPDLVEKATELNYCQLHGVIGCVLCSPLLAQTKEPAFPTAADLARVRMALQLMPRKENLATSSSPGKRIQFASLDAMQKAGVDVEPVERRPVTERIMAAGEVRYDATKTAHVSPPCDGTVKKVLVEVGRWVEQGTVLALVDSQEVGRLKTELLSSLKEQRLRQSTVDRLKPLAGNAVPFSRLLDSENELLLVIGRIEATTSSLSNLGIQVDLKTLASIDGAQLNASVDEIGHPALQHSNLGDFANRRNIVAIVAPISGQVIARSLTLGQVLTRGHEAFRLADTSTMWLDLRIASEDAALVAKGQVVQYTPDGLGRARQGVVTWISTEVDSQTRAVRVRAELSNEDGELRNESFGRGSIILREESDAIVVPESSLQWDGTGHLVFVRDARFFEIDRPKFFVARSVRPGAKLDGFVEILAGVLPGEVVATKGSDVLRAQLLKSNLGAGCTCGH